MKRSPPPERKTPIKRKKWLRWDFRASLAKQARLAEKHGYVRDPQYRRWVAKNLPCALAHRESCWGPIDAAHLGKKPGKGVKACDSTIAPLCRAHHEEQEQRKGGFTGWTDDMYEAWVAITCANTRAAYLKATGLESGGSHGD